MPPLAGQASLRIASIQQVGNASWTDYWTAINTTGISSSQGQVTTVEWVGGIPLTTSDIKITAEYLSMTSSFDPATNSESGLRNQTYGGIDANNL
jgi:hypothetical protein